jgi:hypothetical protein
MSELCSNLDSTVRRGVFRKSKPPKKICESSASTALDPLLEHAPLVMAEPKFCGRTIGTRFNSLSNSLPEAL